MALTAADIDDEFLSVSALLELPSVRTPPPGAHRFEEAEERMRLSIKTDLKRLLNDDPAFANRFDYGWAMEPSSFPSVYEWWLQSVLIKVLSEIDPTHPHLSQHRPIVVRVVENPTFASVGVKGRQVDFICLSAGFMKLLQVALGALMSLHDVADERESSEDGQGTVTNWLFGRDAQRAITTVEGTEIVMRMAIAGCALALGEWVDHSEPIASRLQGELNNTLLAHVYESVEMFIICHELAHFFANHDIAGRDLLQELEADQGGLSLLIIASAVEKGPLRAATAIGPAFFLQLARTYSMCRYYAHLLQGKQSDVSLRTESELKYRLLASRLMLHEFELDPIERLYKDLESELDVLRYACLRALDRVGRSAWDESQVAASPSAEAQPARKE